MYSDLFTAESLAELKTAFLTQFPMALWETFYVTVLSTAPYRPSEPTALRGCGRTATGGEGDYFRI